VSIPARPTLHNGIQMRSRSEAHVASWFDRMGIEWKYEPGPPLSSAEGQWWPDFTLPSVALLTWERPDGWILEWATFLVEVKPRWNEAEVARALRIAGENGITAVLWATDDNLHAVYLVDGTVHRFPMCARPGPKGYGLLFRDDTEVYRNPQSEYAPPA